MWHNASNSSILHFIDKWTKLDNLTPTNVHSRRFHSIFFASVSKYEYPMGYFDVNIILFDIFMFSIVNKSVTFVNGATACSELVVLVAVSIIMRT